MFADLPSSLPSALAILTAMITPALLISACGTFILSTSNRLGRVVDRVRVVSEKMEELIAGDRQGELEEQRRAMLLGQIGKLSRRANLLQKSLTFLYIAAGIFVATSVAIGLVAVGGPKLSWVPVAMGLLGACFLFYGSMILILEARLAVSSVRAETLFLARLVELHTAAGSRR